MLRIKIIKNWLLRNPNWFFFGWGGITLFFMQKEIRVSFMTIYDYFEYFDYVG